MSVFDVGIGIRYFAFVYNFWSNKATAGPPGIPVLKTQIPPAKEKIPENSRSVKFSILHALRQYARKLATFIEINYN